jgi:hypothetical protein
MLDGRASRGEVPLRCVWTIEDRSGFRIYRRKVGCTLPYRLPRAGTQYVRLTVYDRYGLVDDLRRAISAGAQPSQAEPLSDRRYRATLVRRRQAR